jgi:hypothetical protein
MFNILWSYWLSRAARYLQSFWFWPANRKSPATDARLCMAVHDASGASIALPKIDLKGQNTQLSQVAGENGSVCFAFLEPGAYTLTVSAVGFQESQKTIQLHELDSLCVEVVLSVSPTHEQQYAPVARPDHDQGFQQTTYARYQFKRKGAWVAGKEHGVLIAAWWW